MPHSHIITKLMDFASGGHGYDQPRLRFMAGLVDEHSPQSTVSVFSAIICAASSHCSGNPLDKVFALLGVVKKATRVRKLADCTIRADYGKSALQVYKEVTLYMMGKLQNGNFPSLISDCSRVQMQDLPSWAIISSAHFGGSGWELSASTQGAPDFNAAKGTHMQVLLDYQ
jgi:hypothetical protein